MMALILVALVATQDPCAAVVSAPRTDRAAALVYQRLGDAQLASSDREAAAYAFRRAVELDPADDHSRFALLSLCRAAGEADYFQSALHQLEGGHRVEAIEILRRGQEQQPDANAALVEGIALYEFGRDDEARRALGRATADPTLSGAANLFLGLIAAHAEREEDARALLQAASVSTDPHIRESARAAVGALPRSAWLAVDATAGAGHDSNPGLSPSGNPLQGGDWDNFAAAAVSGKWAPLTPSTPFVLLGGSFREQFVLAAFDLADLNAGGGWQWKTSSLLLRAQYLFDWMAQGGEGYVRTHRGSALAWWATGRLSFSAGYSLRNDAFIPTDLTGFSGWRHDADLSAAIDLDPVTISVGYSLARTDAAAATWSFTEHGPLLLATFRAAPSLSFGFDGAVQVRTYDEPVGAPQMDVAIRAGLNATWWLLDSFGLRLSAAYWRNISNIPDFTTTRMIAALDLLYALRLRP